MKNLKEFVKDYNKEEVVEEGVIKDKATSGDGSIQMIQSIVDQLSSHPDYKGKDKELWTSAGQFVYDYMKDLTDADRKKIMDHFGLVKLSDWKEVEPQDVSIGLSIYLQELTAKPS